MRRARGRFGVAVVLFSLSASCSSSPAAAPVPPRWHVADGFLRDPQGRAVILHGVNLAGAHKEPPYFGFQTEPDYQRLRDQWGMNGIRFLVSWAAIEPQYGVYDASYLDAVATRIGWARQAGLLVVLDMHDDVYGEGFVRGGGDGAPAWSCDASNYATFTPADQWELNYLTKEVTACYDHFWSSDDLLQHYTEAWRRLAARVASFDNVVGIDVINEPYWGSTELASFEPDVLEPFYEAVVPKVREVSPNLVAFLEPSVARNLGGQTRLTPFSFGDVMYAPHSYDRNADTAQGFDPADRDPVMTNIDALAGEARSLSAGLFLGEYGGQSQYPGIVDYMTAQYDGAGRNAASAMYWSYDEGDGFCLLNADGSEKTDLVDAVVRPYPERVAGSPRSYAFDAASKTFTFVYAPDRSVSAPTIVSVPARIYPSGHTVDCGGCAFTEAGGEVTIATPAAGDTVTVTVRP